MSTRSCLAVALAQAIVFGQSSGPARSLAATVGIYHWGGRHTSGFAAGIRDVVGLNANIARITVSPKMNIDYNRGNTCIPGFTLAGALDDADLQSALANPQLAVAMITVYDGTGFGDCTTHLYLHPEFYSQGNTARLVDEYSDFVYRLHVLFHGTRKRFILANWEGDNAIYCGQAYTYAISKQFRDECLDMYPSVYAGNLGPRDSIEGMVLWFKARYLGAILGRERARNEGLTGVEVFVAPEFCAVHMLRDRGFESVVFDVIPRVAFDYVSYSSYESLNNVDPASALQADLDFIRLLTGTDRIIVGEVGFPRSALGERQIDAVQAVTEAALAWGVPYIIQWNLYDQDAENDFGLFDLNGDITQLGLYYQQMFAGRAQPLPSVAALFRGNFDQINEFK